jgi:hypothetical protein
MLMALRSQMKSCGLKPLNGKPHAGIDQAAWLGSSWWIWRGVRVWCCKGGLKPTLRLLGGSITQTIYDISVHEDSLNGR